MRVLVCGGRNYEEWNEVDRLLREVRPTVVIQGGAPGADRLAAQWADMNGVSLVTYPALWKQGETAGAVRNAFMLADGRPDLVLAFPGGTGTADMVSKAEGAGVPVRRCPDTQA